MQEDNPCRHSETGDLGKGLKKIYIYIYIFYIGFFLAVAITLHNFTHILLHFIHIFIFYYALILSGFLHYNILTTFHIHVYLFMYNFYYLLSLIFRKHSFSFI